MKNTFLFSLLSMLLMLLACQPPPPAITSSDIEVGVYDHDYVGGFPTVDVRLYTNSTGNPPVNTPLYLSSSTLVGTFFGVVSDSTMTFSVSVQPNDYIFVIFNGAYNGVCTAQCTYMVEVFVDYRGYPDTRMIDEESDINLDGFAYFEYL